MGGTTASGFVIGRGTRLRSLPRIKPRRPAAVAAVGMWARRPRCPSEASCPQPSRRECRSCRRATPPWAPARLEADLDRRLDRLMARVPSHPAGGKLQTVIRKIRRHLFVFVQNRDLTATNNGAERALRPCAVYRKITNGFRSAWGAVLYADIRSV